MKNGNIKLSDLEQYPSIETHRLVIRQHIESDWKDLLEYLSLPEIYEYEPGEPINENNAKSLINERCQGNTFLAVVLKKTGKMIGHLYFSQTSPIRNLTWELGYIFNPRYQGKGFCTEASAAIMDFGFHKLSAHKIVAYTNPKNIASWKVLENIGMEQEGLFRQKTYFRKDKDGKPMWHDCKAYGLLSKICKKGI
jgi:RimJ/RimL family protein N-acetyltransferase